MRGYIFNMDSEKSVRQAIARGIYSTKIKPFMNRKNAKIPIWTTPAISTFGDYINMQAGENVYFFQDRMIYGVGVLTNLVEHVPTYDRDRHLFDCKFLNYPQANIPGLVNSTIYSAIKDKILLDYNDWGIEREFRWICTFKPSPYFFAKGVDMDEVLQSSMYKFDALPNFENLSFIKLDIEENEALKNIIIRKNKEYRTSNIIKSWYSHFHTTIKNTILDNNPASYRLQPSEILNTVIDYPRTKLKNEMAVEIGLLHQLSRKTNKRIFGEWDCISHQVFASPKKPKRWMDHIDIFGYKYDSYGTNTVTDYLIIEVKKDNATIDNVLQLLKYVDWVSRNKCANSYRPIHAFLVAHKIPDMVKDFVKTETASRIYIEEFRPHFRSSKWNQIKLVEYSFNDKKGTISFNIV